MTAAPSPVRPSPYKPPYHYQYVHVPMRHDPNSKPVEIDGLAVAIVTAVFLVVLWLFIDSL